MYMYVYMPLAVLHVCVCVNWRVFDGLIIDQNRLCTFGGLVS